MKRLFLILFSLAAIFAAQAQTAAESYAKQASAKCPREVSDGLVWKSTVYDPAAKAIVFTMEVDASVVPFAALKSSADMIQEGKVAEILTGSDKETLLLRKACAEEGNTLKYHFIAGNDAFDLLITPAQLK